MSRPFSPRPSASPGSFVRVNGKIRAREVRVIGVEGDQLGVRSLADAINLARTHGVDLVEIAPNATPPVCRLVDFGKFRYEQAKKEKEAKKHQHANKVKEIQLSPSIDPHDFGVKLQHAIDFMCEDMKVKVTLRFRGREMAHKEVGFQQVENFIKAITPFGHPDSPPKLIGKGLNVMLSPLPRNKRARNPKAQTNGDGSRVPHAEAEEANRNSKNGAPKKLTVPESSPAATGENSDSDGNFAHQPFSQVNTKSS